MSKRTTFGAVSVALLLGLLGGCTVHPPGEQDERKAALTAGKPYENDAGSRVVAPLSSRPTPDELVHYALVTNAGLEQQYWQWRAAIEQVPIDGTQTTLAISLATTLNNGAFAQNRTVATGSNDPMTDMIFPPKLSTAARRSLETARAAGVRFRKAQFELRQKVLAAYDDYALTAEMVRLDQQNVQLLQTSLTATQARQRTGMAEEQNSLDAQNQLDLARNDLENMRSQLPGQQAALNALLNRPPATLIAVPDRLPPLRAIRASDQQMLDRAAAMNPELIAQADEIRAKQQDIHLAELQYYPDFDVAVSTDLQGVTQTLLGEVTVPMLRHEALDAAVNQARANLHASESMRRQSGSDLAAQVVDDIATLHDADRQLDLLQHAILPRARESVSLARMAYQTGSASLVDLLGSQRSLIDIQRLIANLQIMRDKRLLEIDAINGQSLESAS